MKQFFHQMFKKAFELNVNNICDLLEFNGQAKMIDLGCADGTMSVIFNQKIQTKYIHGTDINEDSLAESRKKGMMSMKNDLNTRLNYKKSIFDVVVANQVIEHLYNSDKFIEEVFRILKPGGYAVISTENASSWINIFASIMGWQIFSLTNISKRKRGIGNPLAIHRSEKSEIDSWLHIRIYNFLGLKEYFEAYGFYVEAIVGAGYFPLPAFLGKIDPTHSHFISYKIRKPL
jgi:ubiquinone/menaquinone biosynthesis C-methylase UbiE